MSLPPAHTAGMTEHRPRLDLAASSEEELWTLAVAGAELEVFDATGELARRGGAATRDRALAWLTDPGPRRRGAAAALFSAVDESDQPLYARDHQLVVPALLAAARAEDEDQVIPTFGTALSFFGAAEALPWLIGTLTGDRPGLVRMFACMDVATFSPAEPVAVRALESALDDADADVRDWASFAFTGRGATARTPTLCDSLLRHVDDPADIVRLQVLEALAIRGDRRVLPHLATALLDPPEEEAWLLESAARHLPDATLLPGLMHLRATDPQLWNSLDVLIARLQEEVGRTPQ